jgi:adenosylmethionine-8-amino-7-oxononanoate aminotransferase
MSSYADDAPIVVERAEGRELIDVDEVSHGHSYSGNALAAAVALRHLELVDEWGVLANVVARSDQLGRRLAADVEGRPGVGAVRQRGLMEGVQSTRRPTACGGAGGCAPERWHGGCCFDRSVMWWS